MALAVSVKPKDSVSPIAKEYLESLLELDTLIK